MSSLSSMIVVFILIFVILYLRNSREDGDSRQDRGRTDNQSGTGGNSGASRIPMGQNLRYDSRSHKVYVDGNGSRSGNAGYTGSGYAGGGYGSFERGPQQNFRGGYNEQKEISEAIMAGESALQSLKDAERSLQSARGWGVMDMFGGNLLSGAIKHSRVFEARRYLDSANRQLARFRSELTDISSLGNVNIDISDFLMISDFLFDGLIADIIVQSKISEARNRILDAIREVETMLNRLYAMRT